MSVPNGIYLEGFKPSLENPPLRARHDRGYISCTSVTKTAGSSSITNKDDFKFYKKHNDSKDSKSIVEMFSEHFGVEPTAKRISLCRTK